MTMPKPKRTFRDKTRMAIEDWLYSLDDVIDSIDNNRKIIAFKKFVKDLKRKVKKLF